MQTCSCSCFSFIFCAPPDCWLLTWCQDKWRVPCEVSLLGLFRSVVAEATHRSHQLDACWHLDSWDAFMSHWKMGFSSGSVLAGDRYGHNMELWQLTEMPPRSWISQATSWTASGSSSAVGLLYPWELFCLVMSNCHHLFVIIIVVLIKTDLCFSSQHVFSSDLLAWPSASLLCDLVVPEWSVTLNTCNGELFLLIPARSWGEPT